MNTRPASRYSYAYHQHAVDPFPGVPVRGYGCRSPDSGSRAPHRPCQAGQGHMYRAGCLKAIWWFPSPSKADGWLSRRVMLLVPLPTVIHPDVFAFK